MHASLIGRLAAMYTVSTNVKVVTQPGSAIFLVVGCTRFLLSAAADLLERKERVSLVEGAAATRKNA